MADVMNINRPPQQPMQPMQRPEYQSQGNMNQQPEDGRPSKMPLIILGVIVVVLIILGVVFRDKLFGGSKSGAVQGATTSAYQAVFLTNGQVYFGKLSDATADYVSLTDIYYLQVVQPPLQGQQSPGQQAPAANSPQISLVKLGNELHGPMDKMYINRSQVLFYEDLKPDGQVVKAIIQDQNSKK